MRNRVALAAILFVVATTFVVAHGAAGETGSWTGEVIDVACYAAHQAKGPGHVDCGTKCVKGGLPVGLLVGDTTYLLVNSDHTALNAKLADYVGKTITVTGEKHESKGAYLITVKDFKAAGK